MKFGGEVEHKCRKNELHVDGNWLKSILDINDYAQATRSVPGFTEPKQNWHLKLLLVCYIILSLFNNFNVLRFVLHHSEINTLIPNW